MTCASVHGDLVVIIVRRLLALAAKKIAEWRHGLFMQRIPHTRFVLLKVLGACITLSVGLGLVLALQRGKLMLVQLRCIALRTDQSATSKLPYHCTYNLLTLSQHVTHVGQDLASPFHLVLEIDELEHIAFQRRKPPVFFLSIVLVACIGSAFCHIPAQL